MSFSAGPPNNGPYGGLDQAREKIAAEEHYADGMNLLREQRRAQGGGPLRRALRRVAAVFGTEDPASAEDSARTEDPA